MKNVLVVVLSLFLFACAMPSTAVRTMDTRPSLAFEGAPDGAQVFIDGLLAGDAEKYDGRPGVLTVEPGTHRITVRGRDGSVLMERQVYVESEIKTIKVQEYEQ